MLPSPSLRARHMGQCPAVTRNKHADLHSSAVINAQRTLVPAAVRNSSQQQLSANGRASRLSHNAAARQSSRSIQQPPVQQQVQQQPQQQQMAIQQQQQQRPVWGYLTGSNADQWTWDDDYNPGARAKAAAAAQALPPTPRQQYLAAQAAAAAAQRPTVITRLPEQFNSKVLSNAVLLVDKPPRWSSADVVRQLRLALRVDKMGAGGPLDAHATGLVILLLGGATRLTPKLEPLERTYTGTLQLGVSTTTCDSTGQALAVNPWQHISDAELAAAAAKFQGEVLQVPCMWSSTKYKNRPLRWYAARGEEVVRQPKAVHFSSIEVWRDKRAAVSGSSCSNGGAGRDPAAAAAAGSGASTAAGIDSSQPAAAGAAGVAGVAGAARSDEVHFRVVAGKGASVRVLADDIGKALGCGAHLTALRREAIGGFSVDTAWSLEVLLPLAKKYAKGFKHASYT